MLDGGHFLLNYLTTLKGEQIQNGLFLFVLIVFYDVKNSYWCHFVTVTKSPALFRKKLFSCVFLGGGGIIPTSMWTLYSNSSCVLHVPSKCLFIIDSKVWMCGAPSRQQFKLPTMSERGSKLLEDFCKCNTTVCGVLHIQHGSCWTTYTSVNKSSPELARVVTSR